MVFVPTRTSFKLAEVSVKINSLWEVLHPLGEVPQYMNQFHGIWDRREELIQIAKTVVRLMQSWSSATMKYSSCHWWFVSCRVDLLALRDDENLVTCDLYVWLNNRIRRLKWTMGRCRGGGGEYLSKKSASHPYTSPQGRKSDMVIHGTATCGLLQWDSFRKVSIVDNTLEILPIFDVHNGTIWIYINMNVVTCGKAVRYRHPKSCDANKPLVIQFSWISLLNLLQHPWAIWRMCYFDKKISVLFQYLKLTFTKILKAETLEFF